MTWLRTEAARAFAAVLLAVAALAPPREEHLLLGQPGYQQAMTGAAAPAEYLGTKGRWTRGDGVLTFPSYPAPATVSLEVAATSSELLGRDAEVVVNGIRAFRRTPAPGWNVWVVPVEAPFAREGMTIRLRSGVSPRSGGGIQGLFVSRATLRTGGIAALARTPLPTLLWLSLLWLGILTSVRLSASEPRDAAPEAHGSPKLAALAAGALLLLAFTALVVFRTEIVAHLRAATGLIWSVVACLALAARSERSPRLALALRRRPLALFVLISLGLIALLFPDAVVRGFVLSQADMFYEWYPWRAYVPDSYRFVERPPLGDIPMLVYPFAAFARSRLADGGLPLWTSSIGAGQPFLATYQSALMSPFTWLVAVVPLPQATVVVATLRLLVGGSGMFLFLRAIGASALASSVGAVAYLLNPFSLVWLEHPLAAVPPWLPWMLLAGERLSADRVAAGGGVTVRRLRAVAWLALSTALVLGAGHPHTGMFVAMLGGAYAVCRAWTSAQPWRSIAGAAFGLTLGCAMVAVQILPFLEYVSLSRGIATRGGYALNPFFAPTSTLITALVPNFLGDHSAGNFAGPTNYLEQQTYPGVAVWVLAVLALVSGARTWRAWFFAGAGAAAMLVMYGAPGALQLASLPLIRAASLPRAAIVTLASLSVLAALGADAVLRADRGGRRSLPIATTLVAGCAIVVLILSALRTSKAFLAAKGLEEYTTHWASVGIWLTTLVVVVASSRLRSLIGRSASGVLIVAAIALDLLLVGRGFHRLIPPDQVFPVLPEIEIVRRDPGLFRVLGLGGSLMPNAAMAYGLQDVRGYDGLGVARYADLLDAVFRYEHSAHLAVGLHSPLIDLLNVKYVFGAPNIAVPQDGWFTRLTVGEVALYRNNRVRPRAFLVDGYTVLDGNPARRALRDGLVDFRRVALVEQELRPVARPVQAASPDVIGSAIVTRYEDELVEIETEAPDRRVLVLMDVHYPGWTATIDGRPEPIVRANFAFRAVPVPAGRHAIRFEYRPASFRRGLAVSATAAAIILGLLLGVLPGRRRPPARPDA